MTSTPALHLRLLRRIVAYHLHITVMVCALLLPGAHQARADAERNCLRAPKSDIVRLLNDWKTALNSGSVDQVSAFYADDATLIATQADSPHKGKLAIRSYFADLLPRHPVVSIISQGVATGCNAAVVQGFVLYRVTGERKGTRMLLGGYYMAEFKFQSGAWQIIRQTLAVNPRSIGEPIAPL